MAEPVEPPADTVFRCELCSKTFDVKRYLTKHVSRMHAGGKGGQKEPRGELPCSMCDKTFPFISHLQRHQLVHLDAREWGCPFCQMRFLQKAHLLKHTHRKHAGEVGSDLMARVELNRWRAEDEQVIATTSDSPMRLEEAEKGGEGGGEGEGKEASPQQHRLYVDRLPCPSCKACFESNYHLGRHMRTAHRRVLCAHCSRWFEGHAALSRHRMESREEMHECACGASFARRPDLRAHAATCTAARRRRGGGGGASRIPAAGPIECIPCGQRFAQRTQLDRHWLREHFHLRRCGRCAWTAEGPMRMREHAKDAHSLSLCGYCSCECGSKEELKSHVEQHHWKRHTKREWTEEGQGRRGKRGKGGRRGNKATKASLAEHGATPARVAPNELMLRLCDHAAEIPPILTPPIDTVWIALSQMSTRLSLKVKILSTKDECDFEISSQSSVAELRERIAKACLLPADCFKILLRGKTLKDDALTLRAAGFNGDEKLTVVVETKMEPSRAIDRTLFEAAGKGMRGTLAVLRFNTCLREYVDSLSVDDVHRWQAAKERETEVGESSA